MVASVVRHRRPVSGQDDPAVVDASGKLSAAPEVVEEARGFLCSIPPGPSTAAAVAGEVDAALVGRDTNPDGGTHQLVEFYGDTYGEVFRAAERHARGTLGGGVRHLSEARTPHEEWT